MEAWQTARTMEECLMLDCHEANNANKKLADLIKRMYGMLKAVYEPVKDAASCTLCLDQKRCDLASVEMEMTALGLSDNVKIAEGQKALIELGYTLKNNCEGIWEVWTIDEGEGYSSTLRIYEDGVKAERSTPYEVNQARLMNEFEMKACMLRCKEIASEVING